MWLKPDLHWMMVMKGQQVMGSNHLWVQFTSVMTSRSCYEVWWAEFVLDVFFPFLSFSALIISLWFVTFPCSFCALFWLTLSLISLVSCLHVCSVLLCFLLQYYMLLYWPDFYFKPTCKTVINIFSSCPKACLSTMLQASCIQCMRCIL